MMNTLFHIEGYIAANNDVLKYLETYKDLHKEYLANGLSDIKEYRQRLNVIDELNAYFTEVRNNYNDILTSQRNRIRDY